MAAWLQPLLKAGSSLLSGLVGGLTSGLGGHFNRVNAQELLNQTIKNQQEMQQKQFDQQNYLASNAIQLKMQDMEKAGINPLLATAGNAFSSGGASAPVNSQAKTTGHQPSNGSYPKVVNAKKLYILK